MKGWRMTTVLGLFSSALLASEPAGGPEAELSLELLEFLGEYGNEQGELNLPDDFDSALAEPAALSSEQGQPELADPGLANPGLVKPGSVKPGQVKPAEPQPAQPATNEKTARQAAVVKTTAVENKP